MDLKFEWKRRNRWVLILVPNEVSRPGPEDLWAACVGTPDGPHRGARWQVVGYFKTERAADKARDKYPSTCGRATVSMAREDIRLIREDGRAVATAEDLDALLQ